MTSSHVQSQAKGGELHSWATIIYVFFCHYEKCPITKCVEKPESLWFEVTAPLTSSIVLFFKYFTKEIRNVNQDNMSTD